MFSELVSLIKQFPFGSFLIIIVILQLIYQLILQVINFFKPLKIKCDCSCCHDPEEIDDKDDV